MMEVGVVGKPNVGKSTFFVAATLAAAEIANYPFTTIEANKATGYVRSPCPHVELKVQCTPKNSACEGGTRLVPVEAIDVAGLVPDAHEGKGLGNKFLDDLRQASVLIHIVDASGGTDAEGNPVNKGSHDPLADVEFLDKEVSYWMWGLLKKDWHRIAKHIDMTGGKVDRVLAEKFTGLGISEPQIHAALRQTELPEKIETWSEENLLALCGNLRRYGKPMIIAANKADVAPPENLERLQALEGYTVVPTCAEAELALRRAAKAGLISYVPGASTFEILEREKLSAPQVQALEKIHHILDRLGSTGVQKCLEEAVYNVLDMMVVYPVEDETHYTDKDGRVLPDAHLLKKGSTARELAYKVHTDLGDKFIRAIDARTHRTIGADHELNDGDVIKIVSNA